MPATKSQRPKCCSSRNTCTNQVIHNLRDRIHHMKREAISLKLRTRSVKKAYSSFLNTFVSEGDFILRELNEMKALCSQLGDILKNADESEVRCTLMKKCFCDPIHLASMQETHVSSFSGVELSDKATSIDEEYFLDSASKIPCDDPILVQNGESDDAVADLTVMSSPDNSSFLQARVTSVLKSLDAQLEAIEAMNHSFVSAELCSSFDDRKLERFNTFPSGRPKFISTPKDREFPSPSINLLRLLKEISNHTFGSDILNAPAMNLSPGLDESLVMDELFCVSGNPEMDEKQPQQILKKMPLLRKAGHWIRNSVKKHLVKH